MSGGRARPGAGAEVLAGVALTGAAAGGAGLPHQMRAFLEGADPGDGQDQAAVPFAVLPAAALEAAAAQGLVQLPCLWADAREAAAGAARLRVAYRLGSPSERGAALHTAELPFLKPLRLQPVRGSGRGSGGARPAYKAYVAARAHTQLFRLATALFPRLAALQADLASASPARGAARARATPAGGVALERPGAAPGRTARAWLAANWAHACLELHEGGDPGAEQPQQAPPRRRRHARCLRAVSSLAEAEAALAGLAGEPAAAPSGGPPASPAKAGRPGALAGQQQQQQQQHASPCKPPPRRSPAADAVRRGVALARSCCSAQLRDACVALQAAAADGALAAQAVSLGALEALAAAAAAVLPSSVMGTTEQLALLALTASGLLDAAPPPARAPERLVAALGAHLRRGAAANPSLLCKLALALLQRPDVRGAAARGGLPGVVAEAYLQRCPMLEPLAARLLAAPAAGGGAGGGGAGGEPSAAASPASRRHSADRSRSADDGTGPSPGAGGGVRVPRLALPGDAPGSSPAGGGLGLTRATRRERGSPATPPPPWQPRGGGAPDSVRRWDRLLGGGGGERSPASAELAALAAALGESTVAADLPAIASAARREAGGGAGGGSPRSSSAAPDSGGWRGGSAGSADGVPPELLRPAAPGSAVLLAHRILGSPPGSAASGGGGSASSGSAGARTQAEWLGSDAGGGGEALTAASNRGGVQLADAAAVKLLLLQVLVAALPPTAVSGAPDWVDPSPVLAAELLSMGPGAAPGAAALRRRCLQALGRLAELRALRPRGAPPPPRDPAAGLGHPHVLVAAAGAKLRQLLAGRDAAWGPAAVQAARHLRLLADYAAASQCGALPGAVAAHLLEPVQAALAVLRSPALSEAAGGGGGGGGAPRRADPRRWAPESWRLLHAAARLLAPAAALCEGGAPGRALLGALLGDEAAAGTLAAAAAALLLDPLPPAAAARGRGGRGAAPPGGPPDAPALRRDVLRLLAALAGLAGRQPALEPGGAAAGAAGDLLVAPGGRCRRGLTRGAALLFFAFLAAPESGFAQRTLVGGGAAVAGAAAGAPLSPRLRPDVLALLAALFAAPGSPYAADRGAADYYVRLHFVAFLRLYHNPGADHQAAFLCRRHVAALLALAGGAGPAAADRGAARARFQALGVVDFFLRELSLEAEAEADGARGAAAPEPEAPPPEAPRSQPPAGDARRLFPQAWAAGTAQKPGGRPASPAGSGAAGTPTVPPLRLPLLRVPSAPTSFGAGGSGGPVPRLNLAPRRPGTPDGGAAGTPPPPGSGDRGRPPRPPSSSITPRASSRLSRPAGAAGSGGSDFLIGAEPASAGRRTPAAAPSTAARPPVPKLSLVGLAKAPAAATPPLQLDAGSSRGSGGGDGFSRESSLSATEASAAAAAAAAASPAPAAPTPLGALGSLPPGFVFSGDLDEDVEALEALEEAMEAQQRAAQRGASDGGSSSDGEAGEPPAAAPTPLPAKPGLPSLRLSGLAKARRPEPDPGSGSPPGSSSPPRSASPRARPAAPVVPRLDAAALPRHSTLAARCGAAELTLAAEAERSRRAEGRAYLGDLERAALGAGKMQAARPRAAALAAAAAAVGAPHHRRSRTGGDLTPGGRAGAGGGDRLWGPLACGAGGGPPARRPAYDDERRARLVYADDELHLQALALLFSLLLDPVSGALDRAHADAYPWDRGLPNAPLILSRHLDHPAQRRLLPRLLPALAALGPPARRAARALCAALFRPGWYGGRARLRGVAGAYATVYRAALPGWAGGGAVVLKQLDAPAHAHDRCSQVDFLAEVAIADALAGCPRAAVAHDAGVDARAGGLVLVLRAYRCSLRAWRAAHGPAGPPGSHADAAPRLRLYLAVFREVAAAAAALLDRGVVHFDLKCDNVLLEGLPGGDEAEFWAPRAPSPLPFRAVLCDFGESRAFGPGGALPAAGGSGGGGAPEAGGGAAGGAFTTRARGTDCFKSPEMLVVGGAPGAGGGGADRRRGGGAGAASDVWSLGCLLYELVTGRLLFCDSDWLQLVARVTSPSMPLIADDKAAAVAHLPGVLDLLRFMLVRDPARRPSLRDVTDRLDAFLHAAEPALPPHAPPRAAPASPAKAPAGAGGGGAGGGGAGGGDWAGAAAGVAAGTPATPAPAGAAAAAEPPLPLAALLPVAPGLVVGPAAAAAAPALRQARVARVVLLLPSADGGGADGGAAATPGAALPPVDEDDGSATGGSATLWRAGSGAAPSGASCSQPSSLGPSPARSAARAQQGSPAPHPALVSAAMWQRPAGAPAPRARELLDEAAAGGVPGPGSAAPATRGSGGTYSGSGTGTGSGSGASRSPRQSVRRLFALAARTAEAAAAAGAHPGGAAPVAKQLSFGGGAAAAAAAAAADDAASVCYESSSSSSDGGEDGPAAGRGAAGAAEPDALACLLASELLTAAAAAATAVGAPCAVLRAPPPGAGPAALDGWLDAALAALAPPPGGRAVLLAAAPGAEPGAALATVARLAADAAAAAAAAGVAECPADGSPVYAAMVAASKWGLDEHLGEAALEALRARHARGGFAPPGAPAPRASP